MTSCRFSYVNHNVNEWDICNVVSSASILNISHALREKMRRVVEPLRELFKDEVRQIGLETGLSESMVFRQSLPGAGLGVGILGEVKHEYAELLRRADDIFISELRKSGWYDKTSQKSTVW